MRAATRAYGVGVRMGLFAGVALAVALVVVVGCSVPAAGPGSAPTAPVTAVPPTSGPDAASRTFGLPEVLLAPKVALPARPRDVSVAGRDPCAVLTPEFALGLGFDRPPGGGVFGLLNDAPGCTVSQNTRAEALSVIFVPRLGGIDIYNRADVFNADLSPLDVAGFPALLVRPRPVQSTCVVAVDIAHGEMVLVQLDEGGRRPTTPQDTLCASAREIAVPVIAQVVSG